MRKDGFVLIETIVMIVFLTISLLMIYKSFSVAVQNEKVRTKHNNTRYLYRTHYIKTYLEENGILNLLDNSAIKEFKCNNTYINNTEYCSFLVKEFAIDKMYITKGDASGINYNLSILDPTTVDYLKTINGSANDYRLVVKFDDDEYASLIIKEY